MRKGTFVLALALLVGTAAACRLAETLTRNERAGSVSSLWPDVPAFPDATKADLEIPLGARLVLRTMMQGKMDFIAFTTGKGANEVQSFYNNDRMKNAGWTPHEKGCIADTEERESQGAICFYRRKSGAKEEGLAIILAQDDKTKQTEICYVRIDMTSAKSSPSAR